MHFKKAWGYLYEKDQQDKFYPHEQSLIKGKNDNLPQQQQKEEDQMVYRSYIVSHPANKISTIQDLNGRLAMQSNGHFVTKSTYYRQ